MDWLKKIFNPVAALKAALRKEMEQMSWSLREREALIKAGKTLDEISNSEECIRIAGGAWVERQVK